MSSVVVQVESPVSNVHGGHTLPSVHEAREVRSPGGRWSAWSDLTADLVATAVSVAFLVLVGAPALPAAAAAALPVGWPVALAVCGAYATRRRVTVTPTLGSRLGPICRAGSTFGFVALAAASLVDLGQPPVSLLLLTAVVTATTALLRLGVGWFAGWNEGLRRVVVAGTYDQVRQVLTELRHDSRGAPEVAFVCLLDEVGQDLFDIPVVVGLDRLARAVEDSGADGVILQPSEHAHPEDLRRLSWQLEARGTSLLLTSGLLDVAPARTSISRLGGLHLVGVHPAPRVGPGRVFKEFWERTAAAVMMLVLTPALLTVALMVRVDSAGPAIYRQPRVGRDGRVFTMLKFRTMTTDAETLAAGLLDDNDCDGVLFKLRRDPRVTRVGRVLRRYSLDELPQLLNVASGSMALVGPRPALPSEVERYEHDPHRRLAVKPGLTGLWQVSGRSDLSWDESVRLDLLYVDNWSLGLDLAIVARTAGAVLRARGAY